MAVILLLFGVHGHLSQTNAIRRRPGAHHVNRCLAAGRVETAAQRFAVDGNDLPAGNLMQRRDPTEQSFLELGRFDRGQNRVEPIVRRDAARQVEKPREPCAFRSAELGDGHKIIGSRDHGTDGNHDDVDQRIRHLSATWIREFGEVILNLGGRRLGHGMASLAGTISLTLAALQQAAEIAIA